MGIFPSLIYKVTTEIQHMIPQNYYTLAVSTILLASSSISHAATFANFQVGSFNPSASPAYFALSKTESVPIGSFGNFSTTISTTGSSWANILEPPTGVAIPDGWVEPAFSGQLAGLTVLAFRGAANSSVAMQFDFTSLAAGFLPAGSVIAYNDIDGAEQATFTSSVANWFSTTPTNFYQIGTNVGSPWLTGQPVPGPGSIPSTAGSTANSLVLTGPGVGILTDGVTNFIVTQFNITSLSINASGSSNTPFAQAVAIGAIPEPSAPLLIGAAAALGLVRRRRA
ncbi:MAG: PEP-CTERM sorting domain-containing protein [Verrucomicrobia bacterium]|nr:MAG: PEP-CTERM sorting domain-containing protein [Verrucomicrobiota bacterium]